MWKTALTASLSTQQDGLPEWVKPLHTQKSLKVRTPPPHSTLPLPVSHNPPIWQLPPSGLLGASGGQTAPGVRVQVQHCAQVRAPAHLHHTEHEAGRLTLLSGLNFISVWTSTSKGPILSMFSLDFLFFPSICGRFGFMYQKQTKLIPAVPLFLTTAPLRMIYSFVQNNI